MSCALVGFAEAQSTPDANFGPVQDAEPSRIGAEAAPPPPAEPAPAPGEADGVSFVLRGVRFEGASVVDPQALQAAATPYIGQSLDLFGLRTIARAAEDIYREAGYPYVRVVVPPQQIADGTVRLDVYETSIDRVEVAGGSEIGKAQAYAMLADLADGGPLNGAQADRRVLLANRIPGLSVRPVLRAGRRPGTVTLVAETERNAFNMGLNVQNLSAEAVGREGVTVNASYAGSARYGDLLSGSFYTTFDNSEQRVGRVSYSRGLTASGLTLTGELAYSAADPSGPVEVLDLAAEALSASLEAELPIVVQRDKYLSGIVRFEAAELKSDVFSGIPIYEDNIRRLYAGLLGEMNFGSPAPGVRLSSHGNLYISKGLGILGASEAGDALLSRSEADPEAVIFTGALGGRADYRNLFGLEIEVKGQWADAPLLAYDEYSFGNYSLMRGYDPGSATADRMLGASIDILGPLWRISPDATLQPIAFIDVAHGQTLDTTLDEFRTLASRGVGVRLVLGEWASLDLIWAEAVHAPLPGADVPNGRLLFTFTTDIDAIAETGRRQ